MNMEIIFENEVGEYLLEGKNIFIPTINDQVFIKGYCYNVVSKFIDYDENMLIFIVREA